MTSYSGKIIRKTPVTPTQTSASGVWTLSDAAVAVKNNNWPIAGVPDPISRSVRFRSSASAYLNRTFTGESTTFTHSVWVKRGKLGAAQEISCSRNPGTGTPFYMEFSASDVITVYLSNFSANVSMVTTAVFRDPSAWYHVVLSSTSGGSMYLYVNNVQLATASAGTGYFSFTNRSGYVNTIGTYGSAGTGYFDGYMTEYNFIDGQALTPSSFGTTDPTTGAWKPMLYTGTYGTNGFYLNFKDNTSTTTLVYDYSGNSNNWTANNISLTAGVTYDSMLDSPTNWVGYNTDGGVSVTRGNYAVLNPLAYGAGSYIVYGNLRFAISSGSPTAVSTIALDGGKWYFEVTNTSLTGAGPAYIGVYSAAGVSFAYQSDGNKYSTASGVQAYGASYTTGDVIGVTYDDTAGTLTFYKNNTSQGVAFSSMATNQSYCFSIASGSATARNFDANFGQRPFTYTPPTGFKALCTTNLPTPTIVNGASYMAATTYSGTGAVQSIVNSGNNTTSTTFQPDFLWIKCRSSASYHVLVDSVRGLPKVISSNVTDAEAANGFVTSLNSNGFTLPANTTSDPYYTNIGSPANTFVGWQWKAGGTAVANAFGSITSQVSANTTAGFSVVTYTGTGANATVGHGLGVAPSMVITKNRAAAANWLVYHASLGATQYLGLNQTIAAQTNIVAWNNTAPTSSVFSIGTDPSVNGSGNTMVAYCFSAVPGYSAFGSYTGNGSADGPFVYCGFRPRFLMIKRTDGVTNWNIRDTSRSTFNAASAGIWANSSNAESTQADIDILSNGFKCRDAGGLETNASGATYIYAVFSELPFNYSNAR